MAKIYGQANRVIVWLGEAADDSDRALEEIRVAAEDEVTNSLKRNDSGSNSHAASTTVVSAHLGKEADTRQHLQKLLKGRSRYFRKLPQLDMS